MEKKQYNLNRNEYVVDGSAAKKLSRKASYTYNDSLENWNDEQERRERRRQAEERKRKQERKAKENRMDFSTFIFLCGAIALTMYVCVSYLKVQSDNLVKKNAIASLESEIITLKNENKVALDRVNSAQDLSYIYDVATKQLGMVHASENQVIPYESTKSDFVKQYADIPESTSEGVVGEILDKFAK
ncbi:septum formation initiator family protein [Anaeromicropila populeti]|uniref:Septum formation initiator n=1 Tax=Anaeromicropila populeti TaxID=37658 RepID=A0A1I6KWS3_9FIRM|nr:septum formation initiator family protein [Anaeromicropila populeti]SFR95689.1 Septum formation initiator [Anaeromicropila populeti]